MKIFNKEFDSHKIMYFKESIIWLYLLIKKLMENVIIQLHKMYSKLWNVKIFFFDRESYFLFIQLMVNFHISYLKVYSFISV